MHTFLVMTNLFLFVFIGFFTNILIWPIKKLKPALQVRISNNSVRWAFWRSLFLAGAKKTVIGEKNIPDEPCLFVSNHRSNFDILLIHTSTRHDLGFIAKKEMDKIPLLNIQMRNIGCIFLDRDDVKAGLASINAAAENIKKGVSMCVFPEGHRSKKPNMEMGEFRAGALKVAEKANCPIVPVAVIDSDTLMEQTGKFKIVSGKAKVIFGEPIYVNQLDRQEKRKVAERVEKEIKQMIEEYR